MEKKTIFVTEKPVEVVSGITLRFADGVLVVHKENEPLLLAQKEARSN